jgi:hypothetical protein
MIGTTIQGSCRVPPVHCSHVRGLCQGVRCCTTSRESARVQGMPRERHECVEIFASGSLGTLLAGTCIGLVLTLAPSQSSVAPAAQSRDTPANIQVQRARTCDSLLIDTLSSQDSKHGCEPTTSARKSTTTSNGVPKTMPPPSDPRSPDNPDALIPPGPRPPVDPDPNKAPPMPRSPSEPHQPPYEPNNPFPAQPLPPPSPLSPPHFLVSLGTPSLEVDVASEIATLPRPESVRVPELGPVKPVQYDEATLASGLRVFLVEDDKVPLVSGALVFPGGSMSSPARQVSSRCLAYGQCRMLCGATSIVRTTPPPRGHPACARPAPD